MIEILNGEVKDITYCLLIAGELTQHFTDKAVKTMEKDLLNNEFIIAIENEQIIGFGCYRVIGPKLVDLTWLAVKQSEQRRGIGRLLIQNLIRFLKSIGIEELEVKTLAPLKESANEDDKELADEKESIDGNEEVEVDEEDDDFTKDHYQGTRTFYEKLGFIHYKTVEKYPGWDPGNPCAFYRKSFKTE